MKHMAFTWLCLRFARVSSPAAPRYIDDAENTQFAATLGVVLNEIPRLHVIPVFGLLRHTRGQVAVVAFEVFTAILAVPLSGVCAVLFLVYLGDYFTQHLIEFL